MRYINRRVLPFPSGSLGRVALCSRGHRSGFDLPSLISHCTNSECSLFEELQCSSLCATSWGPHLYNRRHSPCCARAMPAALPRVPAFGKRQMRRYAQIVSCCGGKPALRHMLFYNKCHFACASEALPCRGSTLCVETADERSDATLRRAPFGKPQTK